MKSKCRNEINKALYFQAKNQKKCLLFFVNLYHDEPPNKQYSFTTVMLDKYDDYHVFVIDVSRV